MNRSVANLLVVLQRVNNRFDLDPFQRRKPSYRPYDRFRAFRRVLRDSAQGSTDAQRRNHAVADSFSVFQTAKLCGSLEPVPHGMSEIQHSPQVALSLITGHNIAFDGRTARNEKLDRFRITF